MRRVSGSIAILAGLSACSSLASGKPGASPIPEVNVTTHEGQVLRFRSELIRGRIAVINFVYTDCTFICTPQGRTFAGLSEALGERLGRDVVLITVTLAPERDKPEQLAEWVAELGGAKPGWTLVTGERREIRELIRKLAGYVGKESHDGTALIVHEGTRTWLRVKGTAAPLTLLRKIEAIPQARISP